MPEQKVAQVSDLDDGEMMDVEVGNRTALLVRKGNDFYALGAKCPHYGAPMSDGLLHGDHLYCPWHKSVFNSVTGAVDDPPTLDALSLFKVRVEGDEVMVIIPDDMPSETVPQMAGYNPSADSRHFVVLGAGAAGNSAVEALRENGYQGRLTMVTREQDLPYDRPDLSKHFLSSTKRNKPPLLRSEGFYAEHGIEVESGREVVSADIRERVIEFADGSTVKCDRMLLATGARPRRLPVPGDELGNVFTLRSLQDCYALKDIAEEGTKAVIVGASFIGMECAAALTQRDVAVTVVAPEKVPFALTLGAEVGAAIQALHQSKGVDLRMGRSVERFEGNGTVSAVVLDNSDRLETDFVIQGVGVEPVTDYIEGVGRNEDGSVTVDAQLHLAEGVYAAGDIARWPDPRTGELLRIEHWRLAQQHGRLAGRNMAGAAQPYQRVPFFWSNQFRFRLDYIGYAAKWDDVIIQGDVEGGDFSAFYVRDGRVLAAAIAGNDVKSCAVLSLMSMDQMPAPQEIESGADVMDRL